MIALAVPTLGAAASVVTPPPVLTMVGGEGTAGMALRVAADIAATAVAVPDAAVAAAVPTPGFALSPSSPSE